MRVDRLLDRDGAGHRRAFAHRRGRRAKREPDHVPERQHRGGPHPAPHHQLREPIQMLLLLRLHLAQRVRAVGTPQHRELAGIDARGAVFAGMVHADHALAPSRRGSGRRADCGSRGGHAGLLSLRQRKMASTTANASAKIRFIAASETGSPGIR